MDCDLLVHEATYDENMEEKAMDGGHSTSIMAGRFAKLVRAKKMVLNHFSKRYFEGWSERDGEGEKQKTVEDLVNEAKRECECEVIGAEDFMVVNIV